jgi:hypothetical protein
MKTISLPGCAAALLLAACAALEPATQLRAGQSEPQVIALMGAPTGRYALPGGGSRLEFARGPFGRTTWMVDLDASGRVAGFEQVLDMQHFLRIADGMTREELLRFIGRPAHRAGEWQNRETWSWRYQTNDCLWFRVTLSAEGRVIGGGGFMPDPTCDVNDGPRTIRVFPPGGMPPPPPRGG